MTARWCLILFTLSTLLMTSLSRAADYRAVPLLKFTPHASTDASPNTPSTLQSLDPTKPVYVKLWASWCQPCMQQMPHFQQLYRQFGDKVQFVAVNIDINEQASDIQQVIDRFGLTMPIWRDINGQLAVTLGLVGTPYSVLLNTQGQQVYTTHESDERLDGFIRRLAKGQQLPPAQPQTLTAAERQALLAPVMSGDQYLFISATWCDWYLKDSRPAMAQHCQQAQQGLNALAAQIPQGKWRVIVNNLWTDEAAVTEFSQKYQLQMPVQIDQAGLIFEQFQVRQIPVLLHLVDGNVQQRIDDFHDIAKVQQALSAASKAASQP